MNWKFKNFWSRFKKSQEPQYHCSICGQTHGAWPALAFDSPTYYYDLSDDEKKEIASIDSDLCVINYPDETYRFIRVVFIQHVLDSVEDLDYGIWVSLSEKSFQDYQENYHNQHYETQYFGWISNHIPPYQDTLSIPATIVTQKNNQRPLLFPHQKHDHDFVRDFYNGISAHEAQGRVDAMLANS